MQSETKTKNSYACSLFPKSIRISAETIEKCQRIAERRFSEILSDSQNPRVFMHFALTIEDSFGEGESSGAAPLKVEELPSGIKQAKLKMELTDRDTYDRIVAVLRAETGPFGSAMVSVKSELPHANRDIALGFAREIVECLEQNSTPFHHFMISGLVFMPSFVVAVSVAAFLESNADGSAQDYAKKAAVALLVILVLLFNVYKFTFFMVEFETPKKSYSKKLRAFILATAASVAYAAFPFIDYAASLLRRFVGMD